MKESSGLGVVVTSNQVGAGDFDAHFEVEENKVGDLLLCDYFRTLLDDISVCQILICFPSLSPRIIFLSWFDSAKMTTYFSSSVDHP